MSDQSVEQNRALWNQWTDLHVDSTFYGVDRFLAGENTLTPMEREALGDVRGKSLLHLQCHFGMDTLSLARMGARVTGVDLSDQAVAAGQKLAAQMGIEADFIRSDVLALAGRWQEAFDIVFTSHGTICWLKELDTWAGIIAESLKPGGFFYIVDTHPLALMLDEEGKGLTYPYFNRGRVIEIQEKGTYAVPDADLVAPSFTWSHGLAEIIGPLLRAGLRLVNFEEFDFHTQNCFAFLEESEPGKYRPGARFLEGKALEEDFPDVPLMFAIKVEKSG